MYANASGVGVTIDYGYDDAGQVTSVYYKKTDGTLLGTLFYTYDAAGRRLTPGGTFAQVRLPANDATATYNANNQLASWNGVALTYDDNGNLASEGGRTYVWNARNQLVGLSGGVNATFAYDGLGRRTGKTVGGATTQYVYDGLNVVQEKDGAGTPTANLVTGLGLDETFLRMTGSGATASVLGLLPDANNNTLYLVNTSGTVTDSYSYEPYGAVTQSGADDNTQLYTGRENDGTGLYYYRARYYHPEFGRFISEDPVEFAAGPNLYAYVDGDPINYSDPFGWQAYTGQTPPSKIPGGPWTPANGQPPGTFYGPKQPSGPRDEVRYVPDGKNGGPASADEAYWKLKPPGEPWQRYDLKGNPITPEQAHPGNKVRDLLPPSWVLRFGPPAVFIWGMCRSGDAW